MRPFFLNIISIKVFSIQQVIYFLTDKISFDSLPNCIAILNLFYKKLFMDLINKLMPTKIQTVMKVFLIRIFPFNFDR